MAQDAITIFLNFFNVFTIINTNRYHLCLSWVVFMVIVGTLLLWFSCCFSYLSSNKQQLISHSISKTFAWSGFVIAVVLATSLFTSQYGFIVAMLITMLLIMAMWLTLVVISAYANYRSVLVFSLGVSVFSSIFLLGVH